MILEGRHLRVRYAGSRENALDGVSIGVEPARLTAVVGPNGSGKTTLLRALLGLVPLTEGEVFIDGRTIAHWSRAALARVVGVVPQREEVVEEMTVDHAVLLGRYSRLGALGPVGVADRLAVDDALARCDVAQFRTRAVQTLSGGEWQRVRVARALAQEPQVLVLDEPTAALDIRHEMEVFELVRHLVHQGLAGLVVTHHLNLAARFADHIVLLDHGRVKAEGAPDAVFRADLVTDVFEWPVAVHPWKDGSPQIIPLRPGEPDFPVAL